jgi:hypothetical protein
LNRKDAKGAKKGMKETRIVIWFNPIFWFPLRSLRLCGSNLFLVWLAGRLKVHQRDDNGA